MAIVSKFRTLISSAPRFSSLSSRLIAVAAVWTIAGLVVGGLLLSGIFRDSIEGDFDARLKFELDDMIAAAEPDPAGGVSLQGRFADPRYERIYSGWYWQIVPEARKGEHPPEAQISRSLWDRTVKMTDSLTRKNLVWGYAIGPDNQSLRVVSQHIEFPILSTPNSGERRAYTFLVAGDMSQVEADVASFNGTLIWSFLILGLGLIAAVFVQVRVGLQPLRRVSEALARIRDGKARRLDGQFPSEIAPLASELNSLIEHSTEVVGRARTHVSNLAHFLKTPLTVLSSEASANPGPLADAVMRHVATMRRQVDHYLARARAAGALDALGNRTLVKPVLDDLARVLKRIHAERGLEISVDCPPSLAFRGERQDLEEMAGNLIDNACKWANAKISVGAERTGGTKMQLVVEDDGPGLEPEDRSRVIERGERLDESVPGSGLGLSIVRDIAKLYGGTVFLEKSGLGGLRTRLELPAIA
ncbi:MAG: sensor histidine kinase [Proteobacteria bacterium]|nr:sensor histidine kinase [Pseudomonadota bacterium]